MPGKLLDTNAVIAFQAGQAPVVDLVISNTVLVPAIVIGELYYGAYKSGQVSANLKVIDDFAKSTRVVDCDTETARQYGRIKSGVEG
jgi:tRNA(fMet)-specific endonuclease VapC